MRRRPGPGGLEKRIARQGGRSDHDRLADYNEAEQGIDWQKNDNVWRRSGRREGGHQHCRKADECDQPALSNHHLYTWVISELEPLPRIRVAECGSIIP